MKNFNLIKNIAIIFILCITAYPPILVADLNIITTIKPFYNIIAAVTHPIIKPILLLGNNSSPHDYYLKPSDLIKLHSADLIIWGGDNLESFLIKPISNINTNNNHKVLDLSKINNLKLLNYSHDHTHDHHNHNHDINNLDHTIDPHFWLDLDNAVIIATTITKKISELDPTNKHIYSENLKQFIKKIELLKDNINKNLTQIKHEKYLVFHDGYQYFEKYFNLNNSGAITVNPELSTLSANKLAKIGKTITDNKIKAIFSEPQFTPKIVNILVEKYNIKHGEIDPIGQDKDLGPNGYIILLNDIAYSLNKTLQ